MDRFIVGTGRCGSTLLSRMLAEHPGALSLSEFFVGLDPARRFAPESIDGATFGALISAGNPVVTALLRRGYAVDEIVYPFARGRRSPERPVPWLLVATLPHLCDDPDALYDEVMARVASHPRQAPVAHYRALFAWLAARLGRSFWLERSASSLVYLEDLVRRFGEGARFLHIHRDGREAALSMARHHAFRLQVAWLDGAAEVRGLGPEALEAEPTGDDPVSRVLASPLPSRLFGRHWSDQVLLGHRALRWLDADQYAEVRFEDLVARPREMLVGIADFLALPEAGKGWIDRAASLVKDVPSPRATTLDGVERDALEAACRPGQVLLGRA